MIYRPIEDFTAASGESDPIVLNKIDGKDEQTVQVEISSTATVSVQGRLSSTAPWEELIEITANSIQPLALVSYLKFVVSNNDGTVNVWVRG